MRLVKQGFNIHKLAKIYYQFVLNTDIYSVNLVKAHIYGDLVINYTIIKTSYYF